jgi:hypothetical protein
MIVATASAQIAIGSKRKVRVGFDFPDLSLLLLIELHTLLQAIGSVVLAAIQAADLFHRCPAKLTPVYPPHSHLTLLQASLGTGNAPWIQCYLTSVPSLASQARSLHVRHSQ